jgi:hypothetical protein
MGEGGLGQSEILPSAKLCSVGNLKNSRISGNPEIGAENDNHSKNGNHLPPGSASFLKRKVDVDHSSLIDVTVPILSLYSAE